MGKRSRARIRDRLDEMGQKRKDMKELRMIRSEEDWIYRVKCECMKQDG